ncbi:MAG: hypothetical protein KZQ83_01700 [gamma proteobacterium symbiont of Taylorina sp.]|nr:hypothetical protein [gamma proteobacterium symbiont of Taylorina sp.]
MTKIILIILLSLFIFPVYSQDYVSGEIIIGFNDSVDGLEAIKILNELKLELKERPFAQYRYVVYLRTHNNENYHLKNNLEKSQLFTLVDIPLDDKGIDISSNAIFAYAKLTTTENDIKQLITSLKNIEITSVETTSISVLVRVPVGHENNQIKRASKHKYINNAEFNYINIIF